ncbi:MAG: peptidylprolyl isomerase [Sediminibacterium sp.]|jgi:peptidyl-prolyl cis-trans isomerase SurA
MKLHRVVLSILFLTVTVIAQAQVKKVIADKIVGAVGDKYILKSDIDNAIADYKRQAQGQEGAVIPSVCQVLEGQLIRKALVLQSEKDSLVVTDEEVENMIDTKIRRFIAEFGSKEALEEIAGKSIFQLKEDFRMPIKEQKLAQDMQEKIVEKIKITPNEVRQYYNKISVDSLPLYESEVSIAQIIIHPKANRDIEEYVISQLLGYRKQVEAGINTFDQLIKLYSEDPGAKENLGVYNLNRNERNFDPAFMAGSFRLKDGQISAPIKSKFGYHLIQLISRSGDDAVVKHILRIPPITNDEINETKHLLDSIKKEVLAGRLIFGEAVNKYSDDEGSKFSGGSITGNDGSAYVNLDQLDKDMIMVVKNMKPGEISEPQVYVDERGRKTVRLIYFKERSAPHKENLKEDYNKVSVRALEEKKAKAMEAWFKEHINNYYIYLDPEYNVCKELVDWNKVANNIIKVN